MLNEATRGDEDRAAGIVQQQKAANPAPPLDVDTCPSWQVVRAFELRHEHLMAIALGEVPAVVIPDVVGEHERARLSAALRLSPWECYAGHEPPINKLGITQVEHDGGFDRKLAYFARVPGVTAIHAAVAKMAGVDLATLTMRRLGDAWPRTVRAAEEPYHGSYAVGVFQRGGGTRLHRDFAPADAPGWDAIAGIEEQLAWTVDLGTAANGGGETVVYRQPWREELERFRVAGSRSYAAAAVAGVPSVAVRLRPGDLAIHGARYLHEVLGAADERVTYEGFAGLAPEHGELVLFT